MASRWVDRARRRLTLLSAFVLTACVHDTALAQSFREPQRHAPPPPSTPMAPPCPTQDFFVRFSNGSALLDEAALDALAEDLDRARPCDVLVAIVVSYDIRKGEAVRAAMAAQGLPAVYTHVVHLDAAHEPPVSGADHSQARVIMVFH